MPLPPPSSGALPGPLTLDRARPRVARALRRVREAVDVRGRAAPLALHRRWPAVRRLDRAVALRTDALRLGPVADAALRGVSRAADHSVLWAATAGGLALAGPRGRRAAVRGVATLAAASAAANLAAKPLLGGERPVASGLDALRRLSDPPTSGSFPSGHTASATAFALGAATEWPLAGLALAPVAGAVAYSRLHVGAHWFSDVAGGVAIGAAIAAVGRLVAPPAPRRRALPPPAPRAELPALPRGNGLYVVVNPSSGSGDGSVLEAVREALPGAAVHELAADDDLARLVADAVAGGARAVGVSGGDGTVGAVAGAARAHDVPLAVFPGGTLNHFAKAVRLAPASDAAAVVGTVAAAVEAGTGVAVDVGELEVHGGAADGTRRTVLNTFALGAYPDLVERREALEGRFGKWAAAVVAASQVLPGADPLAVRVDDSGDGGGGGAARDVWSLFAGIGRYTPRGPIPVERRRLDDGVLDVRVALAERRPSRSRVLLRTALDGLGSRLAARVPRTRGWLASEAREVAELVVRVPAGTVVAHDGETLDTGGARASGDERSATERRVTEPSATEPSSTEPSSTDRARASADVEVRLALRPGDLRVYAPAPPAATL